MKRRSVTIGLALILLLAAQSAHCAVIPLVVFSQVWGSASSDARVIDDNNNIPDSDTGSDSLPGGSTGLMTAFASTSKTLQSGDVKGHGYGRARVRVSDTATSYVQVTSDGEARRIGPSNWSARNENHCSCGGGFDVVGAGVPAFIHWSLRAIGQDGGTAAAPHIQVAEAYAEVNFWEGEIFINGNGNAELHWNGAYLDEGLDVYMSGVQSIGNIGFGGLSGRADTVAESHPQGGDHSTRYYLRVNLRIEQ